MEEKFHLRIQITILEALLVGVSFNLNSLETAPNLRLTQMFEELQNHPELSEEKLLEGLAGKTRVIDRLNAAKEVFARR